MTNSQIKGKSGEREAAKLWIEAGYSEARRSIGQNRDGSIESPDLVGTGAFWVEVKRHKKLTPKQIQDFWKQLLVECGYKGRPLLMWREDKGEWIVQIKWSDFKEGL